MCLEHIIQNFEWLVSEFENGDCNEKINNYHELFPKNIHGTQLSSMKGYHFIFGKSNWNF